MVQRLSGLKMGKIVILGDVFIMKIEDLTELQLEGLKNVLYDFYAREFEADEEKYIRQLLNEWCLQDSGKNLRDWFDAEYER